MGRTTLLALGCVLRATVAATSEPEAQALFERGREHFQAGRYAEAAESFERSDTVFPTSRAAYCAAVSHLYFGRCDVARRTLDRLIGRSPDLLSHAGVRTAVDSMARARDDSPGYRCALVNELMGHQHGHGARGWSGRSTRCGSWELR